MKNGHFLQERDREMERERKEEITKEIKEIPHEEAGFEEVHLIDYVNVLLKRRWLIAFGVFISVLFTGIISKKMAPVFAASAKFLP